MGMKLGVGTCILVLAAALAPNPARAASLEVLTDAAGEGTHGLRIQLGPDCGSAHYLLLDADDGPLDGSYEACRTVTAEAVAIEGGGVTLRAGELVALGNGFRVDPGSTLGVLIEDTLSGGPTYVQDSSPIDEHVYSARFSARFDALSLGAGESFGTLVGLSGASETVFRMAVEPAGGGGFELTLEALLDGGGMVQTPPGQEIAVPAGWAVVEVEWRAGPGDGQFLVGVNGGALAGLADLDNEAARIETIHWGGVDGSIFTASGSLDLDTYSSTR